MATNQKSAPGGGRAQHAAGQNGSRAAASAQAAQGGQALHQEAGKH